MIELRPHHAPGDAPLVLATLPRPLIDGSGRPLCRGLAVAAALLLPALGPLAADRFPPRPEAARAAVASLIPPSGAAAARIARLREGVR
ncbi:hypothetical protein [Methylobacterium sp. Leaf118]|uniref:hypothetical protein n=1 Tax=Methylobacterium sp. Leaf118 TaxID=2876562 RepID=UPI001E3C87E1|nr:hypothetical protein [Methylobacterium sp. Leaf118]